MLRRKFLQALGLVAATPLIPRLPETPYEKKYVRTTAGKKLPKKEIPAEPIINEDYIIGNVSLYDENDQLLFTTSLDNFELHEQHEQEANIIDVTSLDSPGGYREFVSGFRPDNITATLEGHDEIDRKILEKCLVGSTPLKTVLSFSDTRLETEAIFTLISTYQPSKKWRAELFITNRVFNYQNA